MASSSSLPAASATVPKIATAVGAARRLTSSAISFPLLPEPKKPLPRPLAVKGLKFPWDRNVIAKAQLNQVVGGSYNDSAPSDPNNKVLQSNGEDSESEKAHRPSPSLSEEAISDVISEVASLVKLVDSKDIAELQLKQLNFELIIRKKEALPQPPPPPYVMMQAPHMGIPSPVIPQAAAAAPALPSPAGASSAPPSSPASAPKGSKSSHPPLKSPMSGTFYRSPGPGLPSFIKVGDKVNKGQVLCIIEAMKLMNEIEADHAGTVIEVLAEDGKPIGVEQPLFIIEP